MELRDRVAHLMPRAQEELADLVAMRSVADVRQYPPEECERAAKWVHDAFADVGFATRLETTADGSQAVLGTRPCGDPDAPTVLLYTHYDVQPPLDEDAWHTPPFELSEVDGRWYGRGAADCKGNILAHLTALRALGPDIPVNLKLVVEGSEEQGTGGLEEYIPRHAEEFAADAVLICDTGNAQPGRPAFTVSLRGMVNLVVTVETLASGLHSGMYGGAAPDALAALVAMLATLRDGDGNTTIGGMPADRTWLGEPYPADRFRADAGVLPDVRLLGAGEVADMLWARPAVTILGIDCPPVLGSAAAIVPKAAARLNLRFPPGVEVADAEATLVDHLHAAAPWDVRVTVEIEASGAPFRAATDGPAYRAMGEAMVATYGAPPTTLGQGGSIPLATVLAETSPDAEIILMGVEEPQALIHAPNESVDPGELAAIALAQAHFLRRYPESFAETRHGRHL
jgi:acetylornithine deacetylase/succinyl-diaminopimelate desuccinylase-like protein